MRTWADDAFFYHLYPLGTLGAPPTNPSEGTVPRIAGLVDWIAPAKRIGADALLLGPLWESGTHGYDTHDYTQLDRRLGTNEDLEAALQAWKQQGFRLVFDGVFNHCGRGFAPFADLVAHGRDSRYASWFAGVDFNQRSPFGDPFAYEGWNGHLSLVKFNLRHPEVREHLLTAVGQWIDRFDLDGLRLDAADVVDPDFLRELAAFCRAKKPDFWLMGEVIHGDYTAWAPGAGLDSVTNYELFKGLWSSHNDANYHEVAWTLNRQFGPEGLYRGHRFATFGDNHDVHRLASTLHDPAHLYPHAVLTATVPGIPTVYYGSEAGMTGRKGEVSDAPLRPALRPSELDVLPHQPLRDLWSRLSGIRRSERVLREGDYRQALVSARQFGFWRLPTGTGRSALVLVNSDDKAAAWSVDVTDVTGGSALPSRWTDVLNPGEVFEVKGGRLEGSLSPCWGRILVAG